jgi:hypothetical protein
MAQTELIADGKRHGIAITDYLLERTRDRSLMPAGVVDVIGATVHKLAKEMLAEGISREDVATWVQTVRHVLQERLMAALQAHEPYRLDAPQPRNAQRRCRRRSRRSATPVSPIFRCKTDPDAAGRARRPLSKAGLTCRPRECSPKHPQWLVPRRSAPGSLSTNDSLLRGQNADRAEFLGSFPPDHTQPGPGALECELPPSFVLQRGGKGHPVRWPLQLLARSPVEPSPF